jgi:molybdate-binding protein/DNA-binding transcriptional regulator YhcF (GntR family)
MKDAFLYQKIIDQVRQDIMTGKLKSGDRLPSVWKSSAAWGCSTATVQHAYRELAAQGLVTSLPGQGTRVSDKPLPSAGINVSMRHASLVHRAESFLLEILTNGYTPEEAELGFRQALERWQVIETKQTPALNENTLRLAGSHDLAVTWLAANFEDIAPHYSLELHFSGSLGGLIALAEGSADLAGCHLWDADTGMYNAPFVRRLLPGRRVAMVTLAHRRLGLITRVGNPLNLRNLRDLIRPGVRFVNRQPGSGTRIWLDANFKLENIDPENVQGYDCEKMTHSEVARAVAEGGADVGLGFEGSARSYGLDFVFLTRERYDLIIPSDSMKKPPIKALTDWLTSPQARQVIVKLGGYETDYTGQVNWIG